MSRHDGGYGYDPVTFQFDSEAVRLRWAAFRQNSPLQPLAFWALGVLFYAIVGLIVQWRGLNGSLGLVWQVQHATSLVGGFFLWKLIALCEYRRGWVEAAFRAVVGSDVDIRMLVIRFRLRLICMHVVANQICQLAMVMRSMKQCSPTDALSNWDIIYCNSSIE